MSARVDFPIPSCLALVTALLATGSLAADSPSAEPSSWPQFRGPRSSGLYAGKAKLPDRLGPGTEAWKAPIPKGHSSPVIEGGRIFLTGERGEELMVFALDAQSGKLLWKNPIPHRGFEEIHSIGSHAQPSAATDGRRVVSFFGSSGLFGHDAETGKQLWQVPMGPFKNSFGSGASPFIRGGRAYLGQDHDEGSFLAAFDLETGKEIWRTDRSEFPRGYSSPIVWENEGKAQIVVAGTLRVVGYDLETGKEAWTVRGIARITNMTPVVGGDGLLYVAAWTAGADEGDRIRMDAAAEAFAGLDQDKNGTLELGEVPEGSVKQRFGHIDRDKSSHITPAEWDWMRGIFDKAENVAMAIRPGGTGEITETHVLWRQKRHLPYVPSPLWHDQTIFLVKNGGILSTLDARSGKLIKEGRLSGRADYYASPVAADGKVFCLSQRGDLCVVRAGGEWEEISASSFDEDAYATPAIANGRIYVRTHGHLWCFGPAAAP